MTSRRIESLIGVTCVAQVRDNATNQAVTGLTGGQRALIGLTRRSGEYQWGDDSPLEYAAWAAGQPAGDQLKCVATNEDGQGGWGVASCTESLLFVCSGIAD